MNKKLNGIHGAIFAIAIPVTICILVLFYSIKGVRQDLLKEDTYRAELAEKGSISPAHHFLVANWLECNFYKQTKAACFASIRSAAAANGDEFAKQVDAAARELKLVGTVQ
jgi:hypothetical protein